MKRILLKLSGEALAGEKKRGFDEATCEKVALEVKALCDAGTEVAIVIGGGNFWRGRTSEKIDRTKADQIGMLATVMNCIYVSEIMRSVGLETEIMTPFTVGAFTTLFSKDAAVAALSAGKIVFFAGGTGHPYFSTDMAAVLRAVETKCDAILSAKAIDGVYDSDPRIYKNAKKIEQINYNEMLALANSGAKVLHNKCVEIGKKYRVPIYVKSSFKENDKGTFVGELEQK